MLGGCKGGAGGVGLCNVQGMHWTCGGGWQEALAPHWVEIRQRANWVDGAKDEL